MHIKNLHAFIATLPNFLEVLGEDVAVAVAVIDVPTMNVLAKADGIKLKTSFEVGMKVDVNEGIEKVIRSKKSFVSLTPPHAYGLPAKGMVTPVLDEQSEVAGIVILVKNLELENNIQEVASTLLSSMSQLNEGIGDIASSSQDLSGFINKTLVFSEQSNNNIHEIDGIIQSIKNVSSQTQLLSLNARIEAARAGEAGSGFNFVAQEMSKLSNMSQHSAEKVEALLKEMNLAIKTITEQIVKTSLSSESQAAATEEIAAMSADVVFNTNKLSEMCKLSSFEDVVGKE
ncbi:methyl-accepting chemotaxis protein [Paenibacillus sp. FSL R10-2734]|uniref:methyl-accepting chemotaxis protein n=1 Tax=Paenibacillus sp. FSL R10-2734 TaxID=2954691 RepID=UPI0030D8F0CC